jgi:anti-sigma-K factor RskA
VDIKAYIESGAIEAYVLGLASAEEAAELDLLRKQYPELNAAVLAFEMQLEITAMANTESVPVFVKEKLAEQLSNEFRSAGNRSGNVVGMERTALVRPIWKYVAAACIILLVGSAVLNIYLYNRYESTDKKYTQLLTQQNTLMADNRVMRTKLTGMDEALKVMTDPTMKQVTMPGIKDQHYIATVFWDTRTKDVYLLNNNLPLAPQGKQYQLWAIVDGKPVDAGMMEDCTGICRMKNIPTAQAFAITLETSGGHPTPQGEMYVLGKI